MPGPLIGPTELAAYERDGYLLVEDVFTDSECARLIKAAYEIVDRHDDGVFSPFATDGEESDAYFMGSSDKVRVFFEAAAIGPDGLDRPARSAVNMIGHALHDLHPDFGAFSRSASLAAIATGVGLVHPLMVQSMFIFKQPFIGGPIGLHQDSTYLYTDPPSVVGFWCALEDATTDNGCVHVVPGGHLGEVKKRYCRTKAGDFGFVDLDSRSLDSHSGEMTAEVPIPARRGSVLVLHGALPHRSDPNVSPRSRHAYTIHMVDSRAAWLADNWLQRPPSLPFRGF